MKYYKSNYCRWLAYELDNKYYCVLNSDGDCVFGKTSYSHKKFVDFIANGIIREITESEFKKYKLEAL